MKDFLCTLFLSTKHNLNTFKTMGYNIKELDITDRPREKLLDKGQSQLSDSELLAIILGSGNREKNAVELAQEILHSTENHLSSLAKLSLSDLQQFKGIGEAKAINIVAALELGKRRKSSPTKERVKITSSKDAFDSLYHNFADLHNEEFWILALNRANQIIKKVCISHGGFSGTVADPKVIFKKALELSASSIILAHNHPSGNTTPSQPDTMLTTKLIEAGKFLDLPVLDHLIFGENDFYSFKDEGIF
jgi:DNA repair protein RadC